MAQTFIKHLFNGGWATDFGPSVDMGVSPIENGVGQVQLPFLVNADDCIYELDGGPHKAPGTTKLNSAALESGTAVTGLYDAWFSGTLGAPQQHRIIHCGTTIKRDNADGTFTDLFTGLESGKVPCYSMLEDLLIISSDSTVDVPKSWDRATAQNLAGTPPNFSFSCVHKNRVWAAGVASAPSRLYYSASLNGADWVGAGSGNIDVQPDDGDGITGLCSWRGDLWVFKGPYKGSIHRIVGSAPTGDDAFSVPDAFTDQIGAVSHQSIFKTGSDVGFLWSDGSVHSLTATAAHGDVNEAALSRQIHTWIREHVTFSALRRAWAARSDQYGYILLALPIDGSTTPNILLHVDTRFDPVRWSRWPTFDFVRSIAPVVDTSASNRITLFAGCDDGYVRKLEQVTRSIDGDTALSYRVTTPFLNYASPHRKKTISNGALGIFPKNNGNMTFGWQRDNNAQQTYTVTQGGTDVLGPAAASEFTLDSSALGGSQFVDRFFPTEEGGDFRSIQYEVRHATNNEDIELHSISTEVQLDGAISYENTEI